MMAPDETPDIADDEEGMEMPPASSADAPATASPDEDSDDATEVLLRVEDVTRHYKLGRHRIDVLRGVNLEVREGEFLAIQGSSGAGKSTLLHVLGLLDRPDSGRVSWCGMDVSGASERQRTKLRARELAFVFQFYYLLPEFSAIENVMIPAAIAGSKSRVKGTKKQRRERGKHLLERVGLSHRLGHRPHELSGGERQRVALARALMNEPRIVYCDEPTGNLDSKSAESIHELILELNATLRQTFVVVTHESSMAAVAHRSLQMIDGCIADPRVPVEDEDDEDDSVIATSPVPVSDAEENPEPADVSVDDEEVAEAEPAMPWDEPGAEPETEAGPAMPWDEPEAEPGPAMPWDEEPPKENA